MGRQPLIFVRLFDLELPGARAAWHEARAELAIEGPSAKRFACVWSQLVGQRWERCIHEFDTDTQVRQFVETLSGAIGGLDDLAVEGPLREAVIRIAMKPAAHWSAQ